MRQLTCCALLSLTLTAAAAADECEYSRPLDAELDAAGASGLFLDAAAGYLVIEGRPGGGPVVVEGRACASQERRLDDIRLETGRRGDTLVVEVDIPEMNFSWGGYARLDLKVTVPSDLDLRVRDGSGETRVSGVASLDLEDGSGEIHVADVAGDVTIDDGSGELEVRDVTGRVRISDGSGEIEIRNVGEVHIEEDGSGEIDIAEVRGDVEIDSDGSGGIVVHDVIGGVTIGSDGSGSISVSRVSGGFELGSDGSGSVDVEDVEGTVRIP